MVDTLADRVERESADPRWAGPAQAQIVASVEEDAPDGGVLLGARCRTSICRVEVAFDSIDQRDAARAALPLLVPWDGEAMLYADTDDPTKVVIYAAREGMTLVTSRD